MRKYQAVAIDETKSIREDLLERTGKVYGLYFFCLDEVTHICSLTPSRYMMFINTLTERYDEEDDLFERLDFDVQDFYCNTLEFKSNVSKVFEFEDDEEALEYFQGNEPHIPGLFE